MKIIISGSSGLIGTALVNDFSERSYEIIRLVRQKTDSAKNAYWNYNAGEIDLELLDNSDVVVHLAGENIAGLWTESKKEKIKNSRIDGTSFLVGSVKKLKNKPKTFICASAIGIYGSRASERLNEGSTVGKGFLAEVAQKWEQETSSLLEHGIRVVNLRIGVVLSKDGGMLKSMLLPFKLGIGGKIGGGKQFMSWIVIDDLVSAVNHIIEDDRIEGPVNIVSPSPVTNEQFTKTMGKILTRPTIFTVPSFLLKLTVPEMAEEMLLASTRAYPDKLLKNDFKFRFDNLEKSLNYLLN